LLSLLSSPTASPPGAASTDLGGVVAGADGAGARAGGDVCSGDAARACAGGEAICVDMINLINLIGLI